MCSNYFKERKKVNYLISLSLVGIILILLAVFLSIFFYLLISSSNEFTIEGEYYEYQFTEISNNQTTVGFVSIHKNLKTEEYDSYVSVETGSTVIITNFGGGEYECIGSCYCGDESDRRSPVSGISRTLTRGLKILFSAFSVVMAVNIAKETFQNQCEQQFSESTCELPHIHSEVEDCSLESRVTNNGEEEDVYDLKDVPYFCKGHCINLYEDVGNKGMLIHDQSFQEFAKVGYERFGICEGITLEREFVVQVPVEHLHMLHDDASNMERVARWNFAHTVLNQLCVQNTLLKHEWFPKGERERMEETISFFKSMNTDSEMSEMLELYLKERPWCIGTILEEDENGMQKCTSLQNVQCLRQMN